MKNIRKIVAMMAAVLMLLTVMPLGAFAAPGDVILQGNFDDGNVLFSGNTTIEDGVLHWDTTSGNWVHLTKGITVAKNTDYVVSFKMKSNLTHKVSVKFMLHDWGTQVAGEDVKPTEEWADYSVVLNSGDNTSILFMIQSSVEASVGQQVYIDDFSIVEYQDPATIGTVANGSFEDGTAGWSTDSSASLCTDDAYDGSNSLKLSNTGYYASAATQVVSVKANTDYELVWYSKRLSGTGAFNIILCQSASPWTNYTKVTGQNWMNETSGNWVKNSYTINTGDNTSMLIKWTSERSGDAGEILLDAIQLVEVKDPSFDGYITNGDFETGKTTPWDIYGSTAVTADAAKSGDYGMLLSGGGKSYGGIANQDFTVEIGKTYTVRFEMKVINAGVNVQVKDGGNNVAGGYISNTEWKTYTYDFTATATNANLNICGSGIEGTDVAYLDNVMVYEKVEESNDGYIKNGTLDTGNYNNWSLIWSNQLSASVITGGKDSTFAVQVNGTPGKTWGQFRQTVAVEPNTNYRVSVWAKNSSGMSLLVKDGADSANINNVNANAGDEWTLITNEFNSGNNTSVLVGVMVNVDGASGIFDGFAMKKLIDPSNDGYIINGDLETGETGPWENLYNGNTVEIVEGMDSNYAMSIVAKKWSHVRQTNIAVEPNTNYEVTLWAKNTNNMCVLVKYDDNNPDIINNNFSAGDEWTKVSYVFNTGDYSTIIFSLMGGELDENGDRYGTFDNISIKKHTCEYAEVVTEEPTCELPGTITYTCACGATNGTAEIPAYHNGNMEYTPAKEAIDCANPGNIENYFCPGCYEYFADANAQEIINPWFIEITIECVRPEGIADCATVTCETCGNDIYGTGEHDVLLCQGGTCSKCNAEIEGVGCQNYDTPACEDGVCYYCGGFVAGFGHENGAWAACQDGECSYGCGLTYPATEDHVDADADGYCDNCWSAMPHDCIDADGDNCCDICWNEMPVAEIIYGDADGDGEVTLLDVGMIKQYLAGNDEPTDMVAADADGDGEVTLLDVGMIKQYLAGNGTLGPVEPEAPVEPEVIKFNDGEIKSW